ncbi:methyltransferase [Proteinivorax tanatarense]|uniref:Methyltransferase n=1 Tax=Proteinivorax tanatarense TaxID=1260629 RepID=A0AAU7VIJ8_9FIRM
MSEHYFTATPKSESNEKKFSEQFMGKKFEFIYDTSVFSKGRIDKGSALLVKSFVENNSKNRQKAQVLDLGCGYGFISVAISCFLEVSMTSVDINSRAVSLCKKNCEKNNVYSNCIQSDGFKNINSNFDYILVNPPIRAGKNVVYTILKDCHKHLNAEGELWVVIRVKQGAKSLKKYLQSFFSQVDTIDKKGGFHILKCEK